MPGVPCFFKLWTFSLFSPLCPLPNTWRYFLGAPSASEEENWPWYLMKVTSVLARFAQALYLLFWVKHLPSYLPRACIGFSLFFESKQQCLTFRYEIALSERPFITHTSNWYKCQYIHYGGTFIPRTGAFFSGKLLSPQTTLYLTLPSKVPLFILHLTHLFV